jgi:hypothetical protein
MLILCCRCCSPGEDACIHSFGLNLLSRARSARCPCPCLASTLHSPSTGPVCCHGSKVPYALLHGTGTLVTHLHLHLRSGPPYPTTDLSVSVICDLSSSSSSSSSVHFSTTTFTPTTSQSHKHNVSQPLRLQARVHPVHGNHRGRTHRGDGHCRPRRIRRPRTEEDFPSPLCPLPAGLPPQGRPHRWLRQDQ